MRHAPKVRPKARHKVKYRKPRAEDDMPSWSYKRLPANRWQTRKGGKGSGTVQWPR